MRIGASLAALGLAAFVGALGNILWAADGDFTGFLPAFAALWFGTLVGLCVFGLPIGFLVRRVLRRWGWESLPVYAAVGLVTGCAVGLALGYATLILIVALPAAAASGFALGTFYWVLVRKHELRDDQFE